MAPWQFALASSKVENFLGYLPPDVAGWTVQWVAVPSSAKHRLSKLISFPGGFGPNLCIACPLVCVLSVGLCRLAFVGAFLAPAVIFTVFVVAFVSDSFCRSAFTAMHRLSPSELSICTIRREAPEGAIRPRTRSYAAAAAIILSWYAFLCTDSGLVLAPPYCSTHLFELATPFGP